MAEIKTKPSVTPILIWSGFLLVVALVSTIVAATIWGWIVIISAVFSSFFVVVAAGYWLVQGIVSRICTTYTINDNNEVISEFSFISTRTQIVRLDQITSLHLTQNWVQKLLGLGTISFGIFGKSGEIRSPQPDQAMGSGFDLQSIPAPKKVFDELARRLKMPEETPQVTMKPSVTPSIVGSVVAVTVVSVIAGILTFFGLGAKSGIQLVLYGIAGFFGFLAFSFMIGGIFTFFRLRATNYHLAKKAASIAHQYFWSSSLLRVAHSRITNIGLSKNVIYHKLFGIAQVYTFTGGSHDASFPYVKEHEQFYQSFLALTKEKKETVSNQNNEKVAVNPIDTARPGAAHILSSFVGTTIFFLVPLLVVLLVPVIPFKAIIASILVSLWLLIIVMQLLHWKSILYEFYPLRIVINQGIITKDKHEVPLQNLKFFSMHKGMVWDRWLKTGSVYLYTAGTSGVDGVLSSISQYEQVYEKLKKFISQSSKRAKNNSKRV